ncbi:uncharacterized protein LOC117114484 [Anneissia japonica]|uniref:uncharacterized protein LOC117114484 n=1 Tax=Anneissia japonica TaxID=1529436 RepID=UPI0014255C7C|nr:uncharacterized protein LOC117114484 [Anneissia japonica]
MADLISNQTKFLNAARKRNITFNEDKGVFATKRLSLLGYVIEDGNLRPDPERLRPLKEFPIPQNLKSLRRCLELFAYYAHWIPEYSRKVKPLSSSSTFPLGEEAVKAFHDLKSDIQNSVVAAIDENIPFEIETDASETVIAAALNQAGRPVAFFFRQLTGPERNHPAIEKEALAIIKAVRYWSYYLTGRRFTLKTDQKSVSYIFDMQHKGKIKNEKMRRWRIELSCFTFEIVYRPGKENVPPDTLTRACCSASNVTDRLVELHNMLCHPGITRMWHFVKTKNLAFRVEEVRKVTAACQVCAKLKPRFYKPNNTPLIKATQPFERLNIDFKGPLPSTDRNIYFLTVVDEFSRLPFIFPCSDMTSSTVITCLCQLFSLFGTPAYIHSDRGTAFLSKELTEFLVKRGVACSRTTSYNPQCNGQTERYNGIIWKTITLALETRGLPTKRWQEVLHDALHSVRSLLCTATNETTHERFFTFNRRSTSGSSIPSWLCSPGPVLIKRHVRAHKTDPLVDEVELLHANPQYAHVRFQDGRESTVSLRHLAPVGVISDNEFGTAAENDIAPQNNDPQNNQIKPLLNDTCIFKEPSDNANDSPKPMSSKPNESLNVTDKSVKIRRSSRKSKTA